MGCDIHLYVEKRVDGKWVTADTWEVDEDNPGRKSIPWRGHYYSGRNYDLFAILADVRNGVGFAGCDTGDGFNPISPPKGLPEDVCDEIRSESNYWDSDGHSHSWHTLADILSYDWTQRTKQRGWVNSGEYFEWDYFRRKDGKCPESYSGGITGQQIQHITEAEMKAKIDEVKKDIEDNKNLRAIRETISNNLRNVYCKVEWETPYYSECREFLACTIPRLLRLGKPEDVRIVFWFDN